MIKQTLALVALIASPTLAMADPASVQHVKVSQSGDTFSFDVTIRHKDTGWDDYADIWRIKDESGNVLAQRKLAHPHVDEQPFTRSLSNVKVPAGAKNVIVEVHDTVTGWAAQTKTVPLY